MVWSCAYILGFRPAGICETLLGDSIGSGTAYFLENEAIIQRELRLTRRWEWSPSVTPARSGLPL